MLYRLPLIRCRPVDCTDGAWGRRSSFGGAAPDLPAFSNPAREKKGFDSAVSRSTEICLETILLTTSNTAPSAPKPVRRRSPLDAYFSLTTAPAPHVSSLADPHRSDKAQDPQDKMTTEKPLGFGYQIGAGAIAGVSEVCRKHRPVRRWK
jgi:hypothetical protein